VAETVSSGPLPRADILVEEVCPEYGWLSTRALPVVGSNYLLFWPQFCCCSVLVRAVHLGYRVRTRSRSGAFIRTKTAGKQFPAHCPALAARSGPTRRRTCGVGVRLLEVFDAALPDSVRGPNGVEEEKGTQGGKGDAADAAHSRSHFSI
jgi:hypothetical protein